MAKQDSVQSYIKLQGNRKEQNMLHNIPIFIIMLRVVLIGVCFCVYVSLSASDGIRTRVFNLEVKMRVSMSEPGAKAQANSP